MSEKYTETDRNEAIINIFVKSSNLLMRRINCLNKVLVKNGILIIVSTHWSEFKNNLLYHIILINLLTLINIFIMV